jgi:hypothetical protein
MWRRLDSALTLTFVAGLLLLAVWTSYQLWLMAHGQVPSFADAGSYYWQLAVRR